MQDQNIGLSPTNALRNNLTQSQAGALAVIAADIRETISGMAMSQDANHNREMENTINFLKALEEIAVESIKVNDGNIVYWVGKAAKQLNPLLDN